MNLEDLAARARHKAGGARRRLAVWRKRGWRPVAATSLAPWAVDAGLAHQRHAAATTDMQRAFYGHQGSRLHKWTHYLDAYDRHFSGYRGEAVGMLEIGVHAGGSLELWRDYFGPDARIMGIDIDPACADRVTAPNQVRIGSQDDPDFVRACVDELGQLDIVLDDGSHVGRHQWASFRTLFPLLAEGGLYVIEDLHTSYWPDFEGSTGDPTSGIGLAKELIDDMHAWYHDGGDESGASRWVPAIHVYDSMVFIEKAARARPEHMVVGRQA